MFTLEYWEKPARIINKIPKPLQEGYEYNDIAMPLCEIVI